MAKLIDLLDVSEIKGEKGTGFEPRLVNGVDKGPFECGNCEYFDERLGACGQKDMIKRSKRPRHKDGRPVVGGRDCCEFVDRIGRKDEDDDSD